MDELPPELINMILGYLNINEISICLESHPMFTVVNSDTKYKIRLTQETFYIYSYVHSYRGTDLTTRIGIGKSIRSAAHALISTLIDERNFIDYHTDYINNKDALISILVDERNFMDCHTDYCNEDLAHIYLYECYTNNKEVDKNILAQHIIDSIDLSRCTCDDVIQAIGHIFDDSYWKDSWWIALEPTKII